MRQAGRALPEYRAARAGIPMLTACTTPDLIAEVTLQPVRRYGVDAAIIFSDIVVPLKAIGVDLDIVAGVGPVIAHPITTMADVDQLRPLEPDDVDFLDTAVRLVVAELGATPLIGFAGAPFTLASYLVEGGPSREHLKTKALMYSNPRCGTHCSTGWPRLPSGFCEFRSAREHALFSFLIRGPVRSRRLTTSGTCCRTARGCSANWPISTYRRIHFGVGTGELLGLMGRAGADVVGVDWRVPLDVAATSSR